jgi:IS30 family transposase
MPYQHFTCDERDALQVMKDKDVDVSIIARVFGKHTSSIYRELSRNANLGFYLSHHADNAARKRRKDSRPCPKRGNVKLLQYIEDRFRNDHSPEQIAGRIKVVYPNNPKIHISYETIYQYLYERIRNGANLRDHFRQGHKKRRNRLSGKDRRGIIPNRRFIDERPSIVNEKSRIGDWEGDTIEGAGKKGYVATFVERKSKYLIASPLKYKMASKLVHVVRTMFSKLTSNCIKTVTVDNGKEFAAHVDLECALGATVYFAHPYHSWERGLNEHTNGLLRQYLPKNQPLNNLTHQRLAGIVDKLNNRPRKSLGYRTPKEVFFNIPFALRT